MRLNPLRKTNPLNKLLKINHLETNPCQTQIKRSHLKLNNPQIHHLQAAQRMIQVQNISHSEISNNTKVPSGSQKDSNTNGSVDNDVPKVSQIDVNDPIRIQQA